MAQLEYNPKLAIAISRELANKIDSGVISPFYCFDQSELIHEYALKFLVHANFSYIDELNKFIKMTSASGLIEKWRKDIQIDKSDGQTVMEIHQIELKYLAGIFIIWFILLFCTLSTFFIEIIVHRRVRKPGVSRFWIMCEMFIDSRRHFMLENRMA